MSSSTNMETTHADIQVLDLEPPVTNHEAEILEGLTASPKQLSPKFFYDTKGSELFDQITALDEYYLTVTEKSILTQYAQEIADTIGQGKVILEPGSGSSEKIRLLLSTLKPSYYVPMEISTDYMLDVAKQLQAIHPTLNLLCVKSDYTYELPKNNQLPSGEKIAFFPGSTIGNFAPEKAQAFLNSVHQMVGSSGGLLIGIDLKKQVPIIEAAYNDSKGITAQFNLNMLDNINNLVGSNFDTKLWRHQAIYNEQQGCVNMYLIAQQDHSVTVAGQQVEFKTGEKIHTENCYKFSLADIESLMAKTGFTINKVWTDPNAYFAVLYCDAS